ncbi:MAG: hypothetical protein IKB05_00285 [Alphaproteobacteria bacterium]|nr:hypothetical protein [Alphaproteobacteria bacterium]
MKKILFALLLFGTTTHSNAATDSQQLCHPYANTSLAAECTVIKTNAIGADVSCSHPLLDKPVMIHIVSRCTSDRLDCVAPGCSSTLGLTSFRQKYTAEYPLRYCWCQRTEPTMSGFVYATDDGDVDRCSKNCAETCADILTTKNLTTVRRNLLQGVVVF